MLKRLTKDEKEEVKGGIFWGPEPFDWCDLTCALRCGEKPGSDDAMDSGNDEYLS